MPNSSSKFGDADAAVRALKQKFQDQADPVHAEFHRRYHKSDLTFHGLKTPALKAAIKSVFSVRRSTPRLVIEPAVRQLWSSEYFEEKLAALILLEKIVAQLQPADLRWIRTMTGECTGWAQLDQLAVKVLGQLALDHGDCVYQEVAGWRDSDWMWTRRASILIHELPARCAELSHDWSWQTFDYLMHEQEFFIRKAIGWVLRTASKHYPDEVSEYITRSGALMSGLTRREGARNLPDKLRIPLLGNCFG